MSEPNVSEPKMQGWVNIFETSNKIYAELYFTKEAAEADRRMADEDDGPWPIGKCIAQIPWIEGDGLNGGEDLNDQQR